jgi:hypothetical protein
LNDLGFSKVVGIIDKDRSSVAENLTKQFPNYKFAVIPADDVRDKETRTTNSKEGLVRSNGTLKDEYVAPVTNLFAEINNYLGG